MSEQAQLFALVIGLFLIVFPTFWCLIVLLLSQVGGWARLGKVYASDKPPHGKAFTWLTGGVGLVSYRNCLTAHVAPEGLFLSVPWVFRIGHKTLLIPWNDIHSEKAATLFWRRSVRFQIGRPSLGSVLLPQHVLESKGTAA